MTGVHADGCARRAWFGLQAGSEEPCSYVVLLIQMFDILFRSLVRITTSSLAPSLGSIRTTIRDIRDLTRERISRDVEIEHRRIGPIDGVEIEG